MDKQEPKIIAPGYSDKELSDWLADKARAATQLYALQNEKAIHCERLRMLETEISAFSQKSAIKILAAEELANDDQPVDEFDSSPDLLLVSSVILKVVKAELERQRVQPSVENIRCVLALIDGSMPAFTI